MNKDIIFEIAQYLDRETRIYICLSCKSMNLMMKQIRDRLKEYKWSPNIFYEENKRTIQRIKIIGSQTGNWALNIIDVLMMDSISMKILLDSSDSNDWKLCIGITDQSKSSPELNHRFFGITGISYGISLGNGNIIRGDKDSSVTLDTIPNYNWTYNTIVKLEIINSNVLKFSIFGESFYTTQIEIPRGKWYPMVSCSQGKHCIKIIDFNPYKMILNRLK